MEDGLFYLFCLPSVSREPNANKRETGSDDMSWEARSSDGKLELRQYSETDVDCLLDILLSFNKEGLCSCLDTISITQPIRDGDGGGDVLVTIGETFALGFFSPGKSNYRYVGIWYHKSPEKRLSGLLTETIQSTIPLDFSLLIVKET
ncbi:hypothetical protein FNV43_RR00095 [Rhamnella rubrinervis]|uniref:Uncharacterized protein n=1 Tax=Rhamnella rubrinervis TaxID=2594499 RepID=A0A8K0MQV9_9ROSA|nr:hypothetical protein FNV43_RR00095 [Rhamnella rubrinervis]